MIIAEWLDILTKTMHTYHNCNNNNSNNIHSTVLFPTSPLRPWGYFPFSQTAFKSKFGWGFFFITTALFRLFVYSVPTFGVCMADQTLYIYPSIQFRKISQIFYIFQKITELSVNGLSAFIAGSVFSWVSVVLPWMHIHDERKNSNKNNKQ